MRLAVTGASGFIGRHLVRQARDAGHTIWPIERPLLDAPDHLVAALREQAPDWVLHLGWYTGPNYLHSPHNLRCLQQTTQLMQGAIEAGVPRVLGAGTCVEYEPTEALRREDDPCRPQTLYAATKHSAHLVCRALADRSEVSFLWARIFHLFGPGEHPQRLIPAMLTAWGRQEPFAVSPGAQRRDWMHVADVASALLSALTLEEGVVNVCSGETRSLEAFLSGFARSLGTEELLHLGGRAYSPSEEMCIAGDNQRLRSTGWSPTFGHDQAIADTLDAWRES